MMIVTALAVWPTIATRLEARRRCQFLTERRKNGLLMRDCEHNRRRETIRIIKHSILVVGVALAFVDVPMPFGLNTLEARTFIMALVSWLIGLTSWWDRRYTHRLEADLKVYQDDCEEEEGAERKIDRPPYCPPTTGGQT